MKFTSKEMELLMHRLEASDSVAEALQDDGLWTYDEVRERADMLARSWVKGRPVDIDLTNALTLAVIEDCIYGSTVYSIIHEEAADGRITRNALATYRKAAQSIETKTGVDFPVA